MRKFVFIVLFVLGVVGCVNENSKLKEMSVCFERGYMYDSLPEYYINFTYFQSKDSLRKHIYIKDADGQMDYKSVYYQSLNKDTLYFRQYDTVLKSEECYVLLDSLGIELPSGSLFVAKYEIENPPCDGDLTLFFNDEYGLIERYNEGWMSRVTLKRHSEFNALPVLLAKLKSNQDFYFSPRTSKSSER